jgi:hypothetical protein
MVMMSTAGIEDPNLPGNGAGPPRRDHGHQQVECQRDDVASVASSVRPPECCLRRSRGQLGPPQARVRTAAGVAARVGEVRHRHLRADRRSNTQVARGMHVDLGVVTWEVVHAARRRIDGRAPTAVWLRALFAVLQPGVEAGGAGRWLAAGEWALCARHGGPWPPVAHPVSVAPGEAPDTIRCRHPWGTGPRSEMCWT